MSNHKCDQCKANPGEPANVFSIVEQYLRRNGLDGLFNGSDCGCELGDLAPCGEIQPGCEAGKKYFHTDDDPCGCGEGCDWHIGPVKGGGVDA